MSRFRGFVDLVFDTVHETTNLVERTHDAVVERTRRRFAPIEPAKSTAEVVTAAERVVSGGVFGSIRVINGLVRAGAEVALGAADAAGFIGEDQLHTPLESTAAGSTSWIVDHAHASLNGLWGDVLARRQSHLDLGMDLRDQGRSIPVTPEGLVEAVPEPTPKICVFVHGLASTEWLWSLGAEESYGASDVTFGSRLHEDLGYTPLYVRYNSGRHISENGQALARLIEEVVAVYPGPIEEIALVGHSMGGLVARSAAHYGATEGLSWVDRLRHVACLGSPHFGAPLEKAVHALTYVLSRIDAAGAQVPAEVLDSRSVGIKDLRHGYILDEEWEGRDAEAVFGDARKNVPLVDGVGYYFFAATITEDHNHPLGVILGDLLVRIPSASGHDHEPARRIPFRAGAIVPKTNHVNLVNHPEVYEALRGFFEDPGPSIH